jgi:calcineurin-like phosphoesterase family protein
VPMPRRASLERAIGAALIVVSAAGLVSGGVLLGQRTDLALPVAIGLPPIGGAAPSLLPVLASPSALASPFRPVGPTAVLVGAGDIADCRTTHDEATARLLATIPGIVFTAGDNAYNSGTAAEFKKCYGPSWGRFRSRTRPALGNHDWLTNSGAPYFAYFGSVAGDPANGWYSYTAATWHVIVLNSNCDFVGCAEGSPQLAWLKADLAAHPAQCTLAIWHHPRFSSGVAHGNDVMTGGFWQVLYDAGADLIINGHDHDYERFAPQSPNGTADPVRGIREFVVGTGGKGLRRIGAPRPNSEVRNASAYGVLKLKLAPAGYAWQFISVFGSSFGDDGSASCH